MVMTIEDIGRIRLSWSFFMADMTYAPKGAEHGIPNIPDNLDLAVIAGRGLAEQVLEPLVATFGAVPIREGACHPTYTTGNYRWGTLWTHHGSRLGLMTKPRCALALRSWSHG